MAWRRARIPPRIQRRCGLQQEAASPSREPQRVRTIPPRIAQRRVKQRSRLMGKVYLVGAGPGDAELLTLKAARILAQANIVLYDSLVSGEVLAMAPPTAELVDVGKRCGKKLLTQDEINALLVS